MPGADRGAIRQTTSTSIGRGKGGATYAPPPAAPVAPPLPSAPQMPAMPAMQAPPPVQAPQVPVPSVSAPPINGGGPGGSGIPGGPGGTSMAGMPGHSAQNSPELMDYLARVRARLDTPVDTTREVNQLGQQIAGFAQGQRNNAMGDAARRGVLGISGAEGQVQDDIGNVAAGNFARGAEAINLARERDRDQMLMGAQGAFAEPGRQNLADRSLGVQAQGQQSQIELARAQMNLNAQGQNAQLAQQAQLANVQNQLQAQAMAQQQYLAMISAMNRLYA